MKLTAEHWVVISIFVGGLGVQLSTAHNGWSDVLTTGFVSGMLIQGGALIRAMYTKTPGNVPDVKDVH